MPNYPWLYDASYNVADIQASVATLATLGHPYSDADLKDVTPSVKAQADGIVKSLAESGKKTTSDKEIVALIAYLQRLGKDGKAMIEAKAQASNTGGAK